VKKRAPYKRVSIGSIHRSEVSKDNDGRWRLISLEGRPIFRVWLLGIVTGKINGENDYVGIHIEDGSGVITIKTWDKSLESIKIWEKLEVLAQIQISEYEDTIEVFLTPDHVTHVVDDYWLIYHRLRLIQSESYSVQEQEIKTAVLEGVDLGVASLEDLKVRLKQLLKKIDIGNGVTMDLIIDELPSIDESQIYDAITELLESGELFEPQVGTYSIAFE
jgi:RPA family protein